MSAQINQDGSLTITAYSLVELLPSVIDASKQGYELDFVNNAGYPQSFGTVTVLTMFPKKEVAVTDESFTEVVQAVPIAEVIESVKAEGTTEEQVAPVKVDKRRKQV